MQANITFIDLLILPFLLGIIYLFAYSYRNKHYPSAHPYRKYFISGLTVKIIGAIFIGLIYEYYYKGGDTMNYFYQAKVINSSFWDSPIKWFNLLFRTSATSSIDYYEYIEKLYWFEADSEYLVSCFTAVLGILFFTTYLPTAILFAVLSFTGLWALFRTFSNFYPALIKPVAIATLFVPSVIVWGSGIFKDTICIFALGWLTYGTFQMLVKHKFRLTTIMISIISLLLIFKVKVYILLAFLPALFIWILFTYTYPIKNYILRSTLRAFALITVVATSALVFNRLGQEVLGKYALEKILETSEITREWISYSSGDEGSKYNLGTISTPRDMIVKAPQAVNVTLFRPYLWESRKVIIFLSAIESFIFLFLTIKVLFIVGIGKVWKTISSDPTIQFYLVFTIIFAFAVGISTYNFGSLVRYKIPCLPFYALALLLIYYKNKPDGRLLKIIGL